MTRKLALAFGIGASLILAAGAARADCATEVQALQQRLGAMSIDTSTPGTQQIAPTTSTNMSSSTGTTTTMPSNNGIDSDTSTDQASGSTTGSPSGDAMDPGTSTGGMATPTMPSGTVGTGAVTETTRSGEMVTPADSRSTAITSLKKAQLYADAGQEEACMTELGIAKQHMGVE